MNNKQAIITLSGHVQLIQKFYGDRKAKRSQVPLINHINEGLTLMDHIGADLYARCAYAIHPIFQSNRDLSYNYKRHCKDVHPLALLHAMEYRKVANAYLCTERTDEWTLYDIYNNAQITLVETREMLIADKCQNYKDFLTYHYKTHDRSKELNNYFSMWLDYLDIPRSLFNEYCKIMEKG